MPQAQGSGGGQVGSWPVTRGRDESPGPPFWGLAGPRVIFGSGEGGTVAETKVFLLFSPWFVIIFKTTPSYRLYRLVRLSIDSPAKLAILVPTTVELDRRQWDVT